MRLRELHGRDLWLVAVPSAVLVLAVLYFALQLTEPLPPDRIVISTAGKGSGYAIAAERYKERLAREGITLEIRYSGGSAENLALLRDPKSGVDAAFTTVGGKLPQDDERLGSLGGMFPSPVLVLYRGNDTISRFRDFHGLRVSVGGTGTVIRGLMMRLLHSSGVAEGTTVVDMTAESAFKALLTGSVDAMIIPSPLDAPLVRQALRTPGVRLMNVAQAEAIARRMPELRHVVLPRGGIDLATDEPPEDIHLLASTNSLVVRKDLHPALQLLLLDVASEFHTAPGLFNRFAEYPSAQPQDLPLTETADRFYKVGRPFLYRHLGFRIAALADRLTAIMLPMLAVMIPVLGYAPPMYRWLNRRRIWKWHGELLQVEAALEGTLTAEEHAELTRQLAEVEAGVSNIKVGRPFLNEVYHLRNHASAVRDRLAAVKPVTPPQK
jgi:TRAP-type uncharacterized transport system substrate-binding protein